VPTEPASGAIGAADQASRRARPSQRTVLSTRRLEAYTDGVFAIAATLLVLNLSVDGIGAVKSNPALVQAVFVLAPSILNVVISFLLLSLLWLIHVRQFEVIPRVDITIVWLNNFRLLGVVLVPFTTSLNDAFDDYLLGRILLPVNVFLILAFSTWQWFHASSPKRGLVRGASAAGVHNARVNSASSLAQAFTVVVLAAYIGSVAFLVFALDPLIAMVLRRTGTLRRDPDAGSAL
jgi:uncharacterized membrane protein